MHITANATLRRQLSTCLLKTRYTVHKFLAVLLLHNSLFLKLEDHEEVLICLKDSPPSLQHIVYSSVY